MARETRIMGIIILVLVLFCTASVIYFYTTKPGERKHHNNGKGNATTLALVSPTPARVNYVHAKSVGVVADGVTDDTKALQAAINSLPNGGTVDCSDCGVMVVSSTIVIGTGSNTGAGDGPTPISKGASAQNYVTLLGGGVMTGALNSTTLLWKGLLVGPQTVTQPPAGSSVPAIAQPNSTNTEVTGSYPATDSTVVLFAGPLRGGGLAGVWTIDGGSGSTGGTQGAAIGLEIRGVVGASFGDITVQNFMAIGCQLICRSTTDPLGGCTDNVFKNMTVGPVPTGAVGLKLWVEEMVFGNILQNQFGIVSISAVRENAVAMQMGNADFTVINILDIAPNDGWKNNISSIGLLFKGKVGGDGPPPVPPGGMAFNNTFLNYANWLGEYTFTYPGTTKPPVPFGNFIFNYDFGDSGHRYPTAQGIAGFSQTIADNITFSSSFGFGRTWGFNNGSPPLPTTPSPSYRLTSPVTNSGKDSTTGSGYAATVYLTPAVPVTITDYNGLTSSIGTQSSFRLNPGDSVQFNGNAIPTSWVWDYMFI
jgi:hypothetical protein